MEVCVHIANGAEDFSGAPESGAIIELISENAALSQGLAKLREELELERNKAIVANIRHLTQKPIMISSCTGTRLSMVGIEELENKARALEEKLKLKLVLSRENVVNLRVDSQPRKPKLLSFAVVGSLEIGPLPQNRRINSSSQTCVDDMTFERLSGGNDGNCMHGEEVGETVGAREKDVSAKEESAGVRLYELAFKDYDFAPKLLERNLQVKVEVLRDGEGRVGSEGTSGSESDWRFKLSRACEFIREVLFELRLEVFELRELVMQNLMDSSLGVFGVVESLISEDDRNAISAQDGETLIGRVTGALLRLYGSYLRETKKYKELERGCSERMESLLGEFSAEKGELVKEINRLREALSEGVEERRLGLESFRKRSEGALNGTNDDDEVMSCYTFGEGSSANLDAGVDWSLEELNVTRLLGPAGNESGGIAKQSDDLLSTEMEIVEETKSITKLNSECDSFEKIVKLQGRIKSYKQNRIKQSSENNEMELRARVEESAITLRRQKVQDEVGDFEGGNLGSLIVSKAPPQMGSEGERPYFKELEGVTGTTMMIRLYRFYKQTKLLEKQVMQLNMEKQKLELEYEKDSQSNQMNILSSKLIIEAREMEIKTLKEKYEHLVGKMEEDIQNIRCAAREEIEKVWKPKVEEISSKCEDYLFKISSLESELLILRQQLAFQRQLNSRDIKNGYKDLFAKSRFVSNPDKYKKLSRELLERASGGNDSTGIITNNTEIDDETDSQVENEQTNMNLLANSRGEDSDDNHHISTLKSALSKLKTISSEYKSFN
ncbi:exonuclease SBCC [Cryptosporidium felis]|nr:exonuclease SBCC [Cryptosporidium felis]